MKISKLLTLLMFISFFSTLAQQQETKDKRTLSSEVLWEMKRIGSPVISPDGKWVVATVTGYTVKDDKSHTDLWLFASDGSLERPLTIAGFSDGQPVFSPDGTRLAFVSKRNEDDTSQIYILPINTPGEAVRLTEVPTGVSAIKWRGDHIYFISKVWPFKTWEEMSAQLKKNKETKMSARTWKALPFNSFDTWIEEDRQTHLFRIPEKGGKVEAMTQPTGWELPRLSQGSSSYDVSPDGSLVAFLADSKRNGVDLKYDLFMVKPGSNDAKNISNVKASSDGNPMFSPDGKQLAFSRQFIKGFYGDKNRLFIYDVLEGKQQEYFANWDRSIDDFIWLPNSSGFYASIDDMATQRIYYLDLKSNTQKSITTNTSYGGLAVSKNGTLVATNQSFMYPTRLGVVNQKNGQFKRIETINDEVLANVELGTFESVTYKGANDKDIQMWVHYPPGFDKTKKYPLILLIHGGPHGGITDSFSYRWNAQTFASWGYVTAWHNFHGSSGFGQDFTDAINPDWISKPYEDTMKAAQFFSKKSWIDKDRMVAAGASYGGYLSSIILGKEHPFKTLVIHAAVYNFYTMLAGDFAVHSTRFGDYWKNPSIYKDFSPHYFADKFKTPSLVIHGQLDYRVPVGQGFELFRTLQHKGIDSKMVYYPDENHWILKQNNSIFWYSEVKDWIAKYAKPGGEK
jgi:dipeptidyl aminopeptidase/acylaminoacyl peptidase